MDVIMMKINERKRIEYKVTGMTCGGCENSVKRVLSKIEGVYHVEASHVLNQVIVDVGEGFVEDVLIQKIQKLGYQIESLSYEKKV
jgi:copper chaperone CopZ